jgi:release factor glutamine methyltransferase
LALFTEENRPMEFYDAILQFAVSNLKSTGYLYLESHEDYCQEVKQLAESMKFSVIIKKDIYGKERMIRIKKLTL